ncbi:MAG: hypothetical protein R3C44_06720 [Chloroflexota bacterium]
MQEPALELIQGFPGHSQLLLFANRLYDWLLADLESDNSSFTESRARALLLSGDLLDDPTRNSFTSLTGNEITARLAMYDLLRETGLAENEDVVVLAARSAQTTSPESPEMSSWLALIVAGYAWRSDFLLEQLDPASPPEAYSPAGQVLKRAAYFIRQQVQRSATERDKLYRKLAYQPGSGGATSLESLQSGGEPIAPLPPYYRTPIPERYPEYARETVHIDPQEADSTPTVNRGEPISISKDDLEDDQPAPTAQPAIRIESSQVEPPTHGLLRCRCRQPRLQPTQRRPQQPFGNAAEKSRRPRRQGCVLRFRNTLKGRDYTACRYASVPQVLANRSPERPMPRANSPASYRSTRMLG